MWSTHCVQIALSKLNLPKYRSACVRSHFRPKELAKPGCPHDPDSGSLQLPQQLQCRRQQRELQQMQQHARQC